jgi:hypothetical protein
MVMEKPNEEKEKEEKGKDEEKEEESRASMPIMENVEVRCRVSKKEHRGILLSMVPCLFFYIWRVMESVFPMPKCLSHYALFLSSTIYIYIFQIHIKSQKEVKVIVVVDLQPQDVLLGRGTGPNEHPGNRMFRSLVEQKKDEHMFCTSRSDKDQLVQDIIHAVSDRGGRFLRKEKRVKGKKKQKKQYSDSKHGPRRDDDDDYDVYYEVAEEQAVTEKTRQVFQYFSRRKRTDARSAAEDAPEAQRRMVVSATHSSTRSSNGIVDAEASTTRMRIPNDAIYPVARSRSLVEDYLQAQMRTYQLESLLASRQATWANGQRLAGSISLHQALAPNTLLHDGAVQDYLRGSRSHVSSSSSNYAVSLESALRLVALAEIRTELYHQDLLLLSLLRQGWHHPAAASASAPAPPYSVDWLLSSLGQSSSHALFSESSNYGRTSFTNL